LYGGKRWQRLRASHVLTLYQDDTRRVQSKSANPQTNHENTKARKKTKTGKKKEPKSQQVWRQLALAVLSLSSIFFRAFVLSRFRDLFFPGQPLLVTFT
jgi:hypothetical protein